MLGIKRVVLSPFKAPERQASKRKNRREIKRERETIYDIH